MSKKDEVIFVEILMCRPAYYDIEYEINPWMNKRNKSEQLKASVQWNHLYNTIEKCGGEIKLIEPQPGLPDMVFTANGGLVKNRKVLLSEFRYPERQSEKHHFKQWFCKAGFDILDTRLETNKFCFEGEGDALFSLNHLFAGFGFRSDKGYYANIDLLGDYEIIYCELIDPYFYHLDTCFCPLDGTLGIWWPEAFTTSSQNAMKKAIELIAIPEKEAKMFACNAIVIEKNVIIPSGCPETSQNLKKLGYEVHICDMSEFIKAGGACKCLTLFI